MKKLFISVLFITLLGFCCSCNEIYEVTDELIENIVVDESVYEDSVETIITDASEIPSTDEFTLDVDGTYTTAEDVSLYIYLFDELPDNFMTKDEARELGWNGGGLDEYAPGMCIGGDYFGNYEGLLPKEKGRRYTECDINTLGEDSRGDERIVFSNDGLIYYTDDHYESFVLLYDEEGKVS
ncbi:MAG: ribonuclease [Clostridia bacterium]|nr:ribonuclease [Clostridia bacterium]